MYTYKTEGGKELTMNEASRIGFQNFFLQANDLFAECVRAYQEGNINSLAAFTAALYAKLDFLYCVFDKQDKEFLEMADDLLYFLMLKDNPETENVTNYIEAMKAQK